MNIQQEHLPKDKPATEDQEWGFSVETFLEDNWLYLLAIIFLLGIFYYARYSWRKRHENGSK
ncbi:hypothetical protein [Salinimicrobium flavum]|uniref:Uncharacterized protein n=1 Tax=Salinimicrobium flavum TaxID=1737065 RepID=A0ABW5IV40_9FLAO